jgi:hypothetical protein
MIQQRAEKTSPYSQSTAPASSAGLAKAGSRKKRSCFSQTGDAARQHVSEVVLDVRVGRRKELGARDDDHVDSHSLGQLSMSKYLSNQPLSAISSDRVAKLSRSDNAQPGCRRRARRDEHREEAASNALTAVKDLLELGTPPEPPALVERPRRHVRTGTHVRSGAGQRLGRGNREPLASLRPSPLEDQAAILGGHAHEKSMGASPALTVRLERTFHDVGSLATFERWRRNVDNIEPSR